MCKKGHDGPRYADGSCIECCRAKYARRKERRLSDPDFAARELGWWRASRENMRNSDDYKKKASERTLKWQRDKKEMYAAKQRRSYLRHTEKYRARAAGWRRVARTACPEWVQKKDIVDIYSLCRRAAKLMQQPMHVDHLVPLQGKNVSGLHVPWNLMIVPEIVNLSKGAKLLPDVQICGGIR